jgi:hypothetical protein
VLHPADQVVPLRPNRRSDGHVVEARIKDIGDVAARAAWVSVDSLRKPTASLLKRRWSSSPRRWHPTPLALSVR